MPTLPVNLPHHEYSIHLKPGILPRVGEIVRDLTAHPGAFLITDDNITESHGAVVSKSLNNAQFSLSQAQLTADEALKTLSTVSDLYGQMLEARLDRNCPVIALGGGLVGDVAGFAAATFLRGLPLIQIPTTLLAMVDASVGGKTGVNFPLPQDESGYSELGKNLVGSFWQPRAVIMDPEVLRTLSPRDFRCGLAECVKHAIIADRDLLKFLTDNSRVILDCDAECLTTLIERSVSIKINLVQQDEREAGIRALLNLGHTFAHAIEPIKQLDLRHGEAVAIGLCAAAACALNVGSLTQDEAIEIHNALKLLELPTKLPQPVDHGQLLLAMGFDKKVSDGQLRIILPDGLGAARIVNDLSLEEIKSGWAAVSGDDHG